MRRSCAKNVATQILERCGKHLGKFRCLGSRSVGVLGFGVLGLRVLVVFVWFALSWCLGVLRAVPMQVCGMAPKFRIESPCSS